MIFMIDYDRDIGVVIKNQVPNPNINFDNQASAAKYYPFFTRVNQGAPFGSYHNGAPFPLPDRFMRSGYKFSDRVVYVPWLSNLVSVYEMPQDCYAISFGFSGCYMAKFILQQRCYIAHIHCDSSQPSSDCKNAWRAFLNYCEDNGIEYTVRAIFQPTNTRDAIFELREKENNYFLREKQGCFLTTIAGVISPENICYSVLVNIFNHRALLVEENECADKYLLDNCEGSCCRV